MALILTRRIGETIDIGRTGDHIDLTQPITVTVLGVKGNQVRLAVNAPREVAVHRVEVSDRIEKERG